MADETHFRRLLDVYLFPVRKDESDVQIPHPVRRGNGLLDHADPFGFYAELRPATASRIFAALTAIQWADRKAGCRHAAKILTEPLSIYEVHPGSWKIRKSGRRGCTARFILMRTSSTRCCPMSEQQGFTHIELLPLTEHPLGRFLGISGFRLLMPPRAAMELQKQLMHFIDCCHQRKHWRDYGLCSGTFCQ
jgi:1,4-alpha-glucan branching enzyme